ncbi:nucleotide-binding universal stress UspA family protein [Pedobacter cryoconitis]|uniref:Universal stress protein n=1 Tax=Pedobacter cryoconitis TaxID=188932 RepID=A0A7W8ZQN1_9SPHI|nr:universal stress protein [Pedobacter cryoconitis]MBB5638381.1 nucleotide-binding universal stress UspA family protein [Pedobacter cryoconitis]
MEFHKILIAIDSHPSSEIVALSGLQLAKQFNSKVALVSIVDPDGITDQDPATTRELDDMMEHNLNRSQINVIEKIFKDFPIKSFVEQGTPYKVIIETAEKWGADIIIMGTHSRKGLPHLLLGSVAEDVIRHSKKTLIVIPVSN